MQLTLVNFINKFFQHKGVTSLAICLVCLLLVLIAALWFAQHAGGGSGKGSKIDMNSLSPAALQKYKLYLTSLDHVKIVELLRQDREMLLQRTMRIVEGWSATGGGGGGDNKKKKAGDETSATVAEDVRDLGEHIKALRKEHQLLMRNCMDALGDSAELVGVFKPDRGSNRSSNSGANLQVEEVFDDDDVNAEDKKNR